MSPRTALRQYNMIGTARGAGFLVLTLLCVFAPAPELRAQPLISSPTNALGTVGNGFTFVIAASGNPTNYVLSNAAPGLSLSNGTATATNTNSGPLSGLVTWQSTNPVIVGLPQRAGLFTNTVSVQSTNGSSTNSVVLQVNPPAAPALASPLTFFGMEGESFNYPLLSVPGHSNVPTAFGVSGLPAGLVVTNTNRANATYPYLTVTNFSVIGAPSLGSAGSYQVAVSITNNLGATTQVSTNQVVFVIAPRVAPVITSAGAVNATVGVPFSFDITAANSPALFRVRTAGLPPGPWITNDPVANTGLSFSNVNLGSYKVGRLSGVPATTNPIVLDVEASNSVGPSPPTTLTITVAPPQPVVILSQPLGEANYVVGSSFFINAQAFDRLPDNIVPSSVGFTETIGIGPAAPIPGIVGRLGDFYGLDYYPAPAAPFPATFLIGATAQNSLGQPANSGILAMTAETPRSALPTIEMLPLLPGPQIQAGSTVTLRARAIAPGAPVQRVEFYVNKVFVDAVNAPVAGTNEYQLQWTTPLQPGAFEVNARVVSENIPAGALGPGSPPFFASVVTRVPTIVNTIPGLSPSVVIATPANGAELRVGVPTRVVASASVASGSIAQVQFFQNGQPIGAPVNAVPFAVDFIPTSYGSYELFAIATSDAGLATVSPPVTVTVADGAAPTVSLTAPTTAKTGEILTFTATADDTDGDVVSVEFRANGLPLPTPDAEGNVNPDLAAPYRYIFAPGAPGRYELIARATDNDGNVTDSAPKTLTVTVGTPPTVDFTIGGGSGDVDGGVEVLSPDLAISRNGSNAVLTYVARNGLDYVIEETTDLSADNWQASVVVPVNAPSQSGVAVGYTRKQFTVPASGNKFFRVVYPDTTGNLFNVNETAFLQADATDVDGSIAQVQFLINGVAQAPLLGSPYRLDLLLLGPGRYEIVARATDNLGNVTDSAVQTIIVTSGAAPTVSITSPSSADITRPQTPLTFLWSGTDSDGFVARTQLFVNGAAIPAANFAAGSGNFTYQFPGQGLYVFFVRATDNLGNVADSPTVTVTVDDSATDPNPLVVVDQRTITDSIYVVGSQLYFNATAVAQDTNATIASNAVSFLLGANLELPATQTPIDFAGQTNRPVYSRGYTISAGSPRFLTAKVVDSLGNAGFSDVSNFDFGNPLSPLPSVDILPLPPSSQAVSGGLVQLRAKAFFPTTQFNGGAANTRVEFYADGAYLGQGVPNTNASTLSSFTHLFDWRLPAGTNNTSFSVTARVVQLNFNRTVVDANGNAAGVIPFYGSTLSPKPETVNMSTNGSPTVVISSPATNGSKVNVGVATPVVATPTAATNASVREVQFYVDGLLASSTTNSPYIYNFTPANPGLYNIAAVVVDGFGLQGSSEVRTVNAVSGKAPTSFLKTSTSATATALINTNTKVVTGFTNLVGGSGYSSNAVPDVRMVGGTTNAGATAKAVVSAGGAVTNLTDLVGGSGYTNEPTVVIDPAPVAVGTNTTVLLQATATDTDGTVRQVDFLQNGLIVATATNTPYNFSLPVTAPGRYELVARATDNLGNVTDSPYIVLSGVSGASPTVSISNPQNSDPVAEVTPGIPVAVTVDAADSDGSIARVDLLVNGEVVGFSTQAPYIFTDAGQFSGGTNTTFTPTSEGLYVIVARATDNLGNVTDSEPVTVRAKSPTPVGVAPTVQITQPIGEIYYVTGSSLFLNARATDASPGTVDPDSVAFTVNGLPIPGATVGQVENEYGVRYTPTEPFTIDTIRAQATDDDGNTTYSQPNYTVLTLAQAPLPQVQMLELLPGQPQDAGGEVTLRAEAIFPPTANQQARVEFYANNVYVGTGTQDATNPRLYTLAWETPEDDGSYTVEARAVALNFQTNVGEGNVIEYFGSVISDNSIAVNTIPGNAPTVAITSPLAGQTINANQPFTVRATASVPGNVAIVPPAQAVGLTVTSVPVAVGDIVAVDDPLYYVSFFGTPAAVKSTVAGEVTEINIKTGDLITAGLVTMTIKDPTAGGTIDRVELYANGALIGTDEIAPYEATFTPESVGLYNLAALAYSDSGLVGTSEIVPVSSVLGIPPTVTLTAPAKGVMGQTARLVATPATTEAGRNIAQVEFLVNNLVVATLTAANSGSSYAFDYPVDKPGNYQLQARATDNVGNVALSNVLQMPTRTAPSVLLDAPTTGVVGQTITMSATVTNLDDQGQPIPVSAVEFLVNGSVIATDTAFPYAANYTLPAEGDYQLQARAIDIEGVTGFSNVVDLNVPAPPPPDPTAPTVSFVSPTAGSTVLIGTPVDLLAVASPGENATITSVVFSITDPFSASFSRLATSSGGGYGAQFTPAEEGLYTISVTATNTRGQTATALIGIIAQTTPPFPPGSSEAFVTDMYKKILFREPTGTELATATAQLNGGEITRAEFVYNLVSGQEYQNAQNRVADFFFTLGVTPTPTTFGARVKSVRDNLAPMTGFNTYMTGFAWTTPPPFGATLGQVTAAQQVVNSSIVASVPGDSGIFAQWVFNRLGGQVGDLSQVVAGMNTYGSQSKGAAVSFLTACYDGNIGGANPAMAAAQVPYQYQLRATALRFLLGGPWQATSLPQSNSSPVSRLTGLEVTSPQSLLSYIERLLADTAVVLVAPGSATGTAAATLGGGVTNVTASTPNSGYTNTAPPLVTIAAPVATTARANAVVGTNGVVTGFNIVNLTNGYYASAPVVTIAPPGGFTGSQATATAQLGTGATAGRVTNITVTAGGSGYSASAPPLVSIEAPAPIQAAAGSIGISPAGQITNVAIKDGGSGYRTNAPSVLIGGPSRLTVPGGSSVPLSAQVLTNSSLFTVTAYILLTNNKPALTNATGSFANYTAPALVGTNRMTNTISVRAIGTNGVTIGESAWTTLIVE